VRRYNYEAEKEVEKKILISDRNKNVREYLKREMKIDGYRVELAKSAGEILDRIRHDDSIRLLILDPDLPDLEYETLMQTLIEMTAKLPVILHSYSNNREDESGAYKPLHFVEKRGHGIDNLKQVVSSLLKKAENI
jgi:DNA-binding NtrC family response regulator